MSNVVQTFRQNDREWPLVCQAFDANGLKDLTIFTGGIVFKMVSGATVVTGTATGDAQGNLTYPWGATDLALPGTYAATFTGTDAGSKKGTMPSGFNLTIIVIPAL